MHREPTTVIEALLGIFAGVVLLASVATIVVVFVRSILDAIA